MKALAQTPQGVASRRRALIAFAAVSVTARVAFSAAVDVQSAGNAAWLQALLFPIACLPGAAAFFYCAGREVHAAVRKGSCALFCLIFIPEFSSWLYALGECVAYTTFSDMPTLALLVPALLVAAYAASLGGDAVGGLGQVQLAIIPWCFLLSAVCQARGMRPLYLTPILGGGVRSLARGTVICAGAGLSLPAGLWLFWNAGEDGVPLRDRRAAVRALLGCAAGAAAMLVVYGMLVPNFTGSPRTPTRAIEQLLMGGGASTSVQFLLMIVWYSLLFLGCVFSCSAAAHCLKGLFTGLSLRACAWWTTAPCLALVPVWMRVGNAREGMLRWRYVLFTAVLALLAVSAWISERRKKRHAG